MEENDDQGRIFKDTYISDIKSDLNEGHASPLDVMIIKQFQHTKFHNGQTI